MKHNIAKKILNTEKDKLMLEPEANRDWELITALEIAIEAVNEIDNYGNCVLTMFGDCSYEETGCSDCKIKEKIRKALENERPQGEWILVEHKKNIDLVCPHCGYHRCNLAYGFSIEEVREQIKEDKSNDYLLPAFCERCGAKLGFGGNKE